MQIPEASGILLLRIHLFSLIFLLSPYPVHLILLSSSPMPSFPILSYFCFTLFLLLLFISLFLVFSPFPLVLAYVLGMFFSISLFSCFWLYLEFYVPHTILFTLPLNCFLITPRSLSFFLPSFLCLSPSLTFSFFSTYLFALSLSLLLSFYH